MPQSALSRVQDDGLRGSGAYSAAAAALLVAERVARDYGGGRGGSAGGSGGAQEAARRSVGAGADVVPRSPHARPLRQQQQQWQQQQQQQMLPQTHGNPHSTPQYPPPVPSTGGAVPAGGPGYGRGIAEAGPPSPGGVPVWLTGMLGDAPWTAREATRGAAAAVDEGAGFGGGVAHVRATRDGGVGGVSAQASSWPGGGVGGAGRVDGVGEADDADTPASLARLEALLRRGHGA
eukprot:365620-Chlamydomonas_euryale.AAC.3